ncbi:tRNA lysidine(34) synthetase TilS [Pararhizobium arenae]|uniref:tRNA lysidine(34) synthetase TilS n=1 Tax=Pararhizobium arenae TaxID=1856850 RepID=UPI00094B05D5|nr:tRNA lysidine(34) synthetase TilS [Pararhizobium arenae]
MTDPVIAAARDFLQRFSAPGMLLVAISGGSDSTGLLLALKTAVDDVGRGFAVAACTIDHGLRAASAEEARSVGILCERLGISHSIRRWEGEKPSSGIQAAARAARYRLLADAAAEIDAIAVVTGHTADDQAETIAMRSRRSGDDAPGLSGMADAVLYDRSVWILRPFLGLTRQDIRTFLQERGEGWLDDPSNTNPAFERVRVRNAISQKARQAPSSPPVGEDARRADEGAFAANSEPAAPSSGALRHLLPQGEKRELAATSEAGHQRMVRAERIAELLGDVSVVEGLVARISSALVDRINEPKVLAAILLVSTVIGGAAHVPGRDAAKRVADFLAQGEPGRITASRTVFDRRRDALYLYREKRSLPVTVLDAGKQAVWDGRFVVANRSASAVSLRPAAGVELESAEARLIAAGVRREIARRAAPAALAAVAISAGNSEQNHVITRHIPPYDTFLPRLDLTLANRLAALFGRSRYLALPVHDVLTEITGD